MENFLSDHPGVTLAITVPPPVALIPGTAALDYFSDLKDRLDYLLHHINAVRPGFLGFTTPESQAFGSFKYFYHGAATE